MVDLGRAGTSTETDLVAIEASSIVFEVFCIELADDGEADGEPDGWVEPGGPNCRIEAIGSPGEDWEQIVYDSGIENVVWRRGERYNWR
jgi:hypothetical protein